MDHPVVAAVREFVDVEVRPVAAGLEHADAYPHALVARLRELGLFGALVPAEYGITGTKMFITNGREGNTLALLALTDLRAEPRHRGMSCFIVEKGHPGFRVVKSVAKLGYKGVDTAELVFDECVVPAGNLVGGVEGRGFKHVMGGLEAGRINIAARAVGVAQAAYDDTVAHLASTSADAPPAVADMATKLRAARLLTSWAAAMKDRGERCDLEAGMAKLFASESAQEVAVEALRLHGGAGSLAALNV